MASSTTNSDTAGEPLSAKNQTLLTGAAFTQVRQMAPTLGRTLTVTLRRTWPPSRTSALT